MEANPTKKQRKSEAEIITQICKITVRFRKWCWDDYKRLAKFLRPVNFPYLGSLESFPIIEPEIESIKWTRKYHASIAGILILFRSNEKAKREMLKQFIKDIDLKTDIDKVVKQLDNFMIIHKFMYNCRKWYRYVDIDFAKKTHRSTPEYINDNENGAHVYEKMFVGDIVSDKTKTQLYDDIYTKYSIRLETIDIEWNKD